MSGRDIGASVRQRLPNKSRTQGRPFQELLQYFGMERFLYRLAKSPYSDRSVLKGALLLTAWRAPQSRPTMDIDLAGRVNNQLDQIREVVATVCGVSVEPDGIAFNGASIEVSRIKEARLCSFVRCWNGFHLIVLQNRRNRKRPLARLMPAKTSNINAVRRVQACRPAATARWKSATGTLRGMPPAIISASNP